MNRSTRFILLVLLVGAAFRPPEAAAPTASVHDHLRRLVQHGLKAVPYVGTPASELLFGSEAAAQLQVQQQILQTHRSSLAQLKALAQSAWAAQQKLEELDRQRQAGLAAARGLQDLPYAQAIEGLTAAGLELQAAPGAYLPTTPYRRQLQALWSSREGRGCVERARCFFQHTTRAVGQSRGKPRTLAAWQAAVQQGAQYDSTLQAYAAHRKLALAQHYEAQAAALLQGNQALQATLEKAELPLAAQLQAYRLLHQHVKEATHLQERATALVQEGATLREEDKAVLAAEADRALALSIIGLELHHE